MPLEPLFLRPSDITARRGGRALNRIQGRPAIRICGSVDAGEFTRIADPYQASGRLVCDAEFVLVSPRVFAVVGQFSVTLSATCQRCLEAFSYEGSGELDVGVVEADADVPTGASADDFLVLEGQPLDVMRLFEDELLLALPMVPMHSGDCAKASTAQDPALSEEAPSPFEVLAALRPAGRSE